MGSNIKCAAELHKATTVGNKGSFFLSKAGFHLFLSKMFTIQFFFLLHLN